MIRNKEKGWGGMQVSCALDFKGNKMHIAMSVKKELKGIDLLVYG